VEVKACETLVASFAKALVFATNLPVVMRVCFFFLLNLEIKQGKQVLATTQKRELVSGGVSFYDVVKILTSHCIYFLLCAHQASCVRCHPVQIRTTCPSVSWLKRIQWKRRVALCGYSLDPSKHVHALLCAGRVRSHTFFLLYTHDMFICQ
jgi:hypothetical protein